MCLGARQRQLGFYHYLNLVSLAQVQSEEVVQNQMIALDLTFPGLLCMRVWGLGLGESTPNEGKYAMLFNFNGRTFSKNTSSRHTITFANLGHQSL